MDKTNVLLTSAGSKVGLVTGVIRALGKFNAGWKVLPADINELCPAAHLFEGFIVSEPFERMDQDALLSFLRENRVRAVLPSRDAELPFWSSVRDDLDSEGTDVITSKLWTLNIMQDKLEFYSWGVTVGLPVIQTSERVNEISANRLVVKERFGSGSRGIAIGVSREDASRIVAGFTSPVFQPVVEGTEVSVDAFLNRDSRVHGLVLRSRDRVKNGESEVTTTFRDVELEDFAQRLLNQSGLSGPVVMQLFVTDSGPQVIEINPRFGGVSTASIAVGLESLYWALHEVFHPESPLPEFRRAKQEFRNIRVPRDMTLPW